jgi:hypothetical protein
MRKLATFTLLLISSISFSQRFSRWDGTSNKYTDSKIEELHKFKNDYYGFYSIPEIWTKMLFGENRIKERKIYYQDNNTPSYLLAEVKYNLYGDIILIDLYNKEGEIERKVKKTYDNRFQVTNEVYYNSEDKTMYQIFSKYKDNERDVYCYKGNLKKLIYRISRKLINDSVLNETLYLKGKKKYWRKEFVFPPKSNYMKSVNLYDKNEILIESWDYSCWGSNKFNTEPRTVIDSLGNKKLYSYMIDDKCRLLNRIEYRDNNDKTIEQKSFNEDSVLTYRVLNPDSSNNYTETEYFYTPTNKIPVCKEKTITFFNDKNKVIKCENYNYKNGLSILSDIISYKYDENENLIEAIYSKYKNDVVIAINRNILTY